MVQCGLVKNVNKPWEHEKYINNTYNPTVVSKLDENYKLMIEKLVIQSKYPNIRFIDKGGVAEPDTTPEVLIDKVKGIVDVKYSFGHTYKDLENPYIRVLYSLDKDAPLNIVGTYELGHTLTVNDIEYIRGIKLSEDATVTQYLAHKNSLLNTGVYSLNGNIVIVITDDEIEKYSNADEYIKLINSSDLIFARKVGNNFKLANIYSLTFTNEVKKCIDRTISGLVKEPYINDAKIAEDFIHQMRRLYPNIQFYNVESQRDNTNYKEFCCYTINPSVSRSDIFTSRVFSSPGYGKWWVTGFTAQFEYSSVDLPTVLSRKEEYRRYEFFSNKCRFHYHTKKGEKIQYTVMWKKMMDDNYNTQTNQDNNSLAQYSIRFDCTVTFTNVEHEHVDYPKALHVISSIIGVESIPKDTSACYSEKELTPIVENNRVKGNIIKSPDLSNGANDIPSGKDYTTDCPKCNNTPTEVEEQEIIEEEIIDEDGCLL